MKSILTLVMSSVLAFTGCAASPGPAASGAADVAFPAGAVADYQLGGAYPPAPGTEIVVRDSTDEPAAGLYSVCYINGFQTQPGVEWPAELLLHEDGDAIVDPDWPDEYVLDISEGEKRTQILNQLEPVITGCAERGFDAVEFDNLDTFTRFGEHLTEEHAIAFATGLVKLAHDAGLDAAQKNTVELVDVGRDQIGFDFAIAEECDQYEECGAYTEVYGDQVLAIEYTDELRRDFSEVCADPERPATMLLRDRDLVTPDDPAYHYEHC